MVVYEKIFEFYIGHKILAELKDLNNLTEVNKTKAWWRSFFPINHWFDTVPFRRLCEKNLDTRYTISSHAHGSMQHQGFLKNIISFCGATDIPFLALWWRLP